VPIVERSLWAALRSSCVDAVLVSWVVVWRELVLAGCGFGRGCCGHMCLFSSGDMVWKSTKRLFSRGLGGQESSQAEFLTSPPLGFTLLQIHFLSRVPRIATASTHHRRDEQSNADGNLTGQY
jgi:hypothetical protein